jgi:predicted kinase
VTELIITRGLPASGKTTWAKAWVAEEQRLRARVNRDDLRLNLYGLPAPLPWELEQAVSAAQQEAVRGLLRAGRSVVVDDTHLRQRYIRAWREIADDEGADFSVNADFLDVPVEECIRRDHDRYAYGHGPMVGADVIMDMSDRLKNALKSEARDSTPEPEPRRYVPDTSLRPAWIVDIDGTLARMTGRSPYDTTRVMEDAPVKEVVDLVHALYAVGNRILVVSGRDTECRGDTIRWLDAWVGTDTIHDLYMRGHGDTRDDAIIKAEIFFEHIAPNFNVRGVLDDRNRVVRMWRGLGLLCCQVAPGAF